MADLASTQREPFVLLDDARAQGAAKAHLYQRPAQLFVARRADEVEPVLRAADNARREAGKPLVGYIAYEAGLALEPKLRARADRRTGAAGPLVWLGLFDQETILAAEEAHAWLAAHGQGDATLGPLEPQLSFAGYDDAFSRMQDAIRAGDIYQANLTFPLAATFRGDPLALYRALRPAAQAGYGGLVYDGADWLLSLSPELFVSLRGAEAKAKPMKGTRPRSDNAAKDAAFAQDLATSMKDRAENLMIVDLLRNDLSRVAVPGSVQVDDPFVIETYPTVHQMVSTVRAQLRDGMGPMQLVQAMFPCGSITGAPKIRAMELIDEVERDPRGPYCGAIGRIDACGDAAFNVAIRTLRLTPTENGQGTAVLGVGSAIVADSVAEAEWRECLLKGQFARKSSPQLRAPQFDLIETMRFGPGEGIALLDRHLQRMAASAHELGFNFQQDTTRSQIDAFCARLTTPMQVRLLTARSGAISLTASALPATPDQALECIVLPLPVGPADWRLRHKTTDRGFYTDARSVAQEAGADEALFVRSDGLLTEGSWTSIFLERDGILLTPPARRGLLPGVMRQSLMATGKAQEADITLDDLSGGFLLGNAVRGLMPARLVL